MAYIGRGTDKISNVEKLDNISFSGSTATFNLTKGGTAFIPSSAECIRLAIDGIEQGNNYTVSGSQITFDFTPSGSSTNNWIYHIGVGVITTPGDGTVTSAKLGSSAVTTAKIDADAVDGTKIADDSISDEHLDVTAITGQPEKTSLVDADKFLISDSAASGALKYVQKSNLPSGGMTLVGNSESSSQVNNLIIDNCFTSTYKHYVAKVIFAPTSNADVWMRYRTGGSSGSSRTNSDHVWLSHSIYKGNSSQGLSEACAYNDDKFKISYDMQSDNDSGLTVSTINFYDPNSQQFSRQYWNALSFWQYNSSNRFYGGHFHGMNQSNVDATGFELIPSSGYIGYHSVKVYGLKDS